MQTFAAARCLALMDPDLLFLEGVRDRGASSGEAGAVLRRRSLLCISALVLTTTSPELAGVAAVAAATAAAMDEAVLVLLGGRALSSDPSEWSSWQRSCVWLEWVGVAPLSGVVALYCRSLSLSLSPRSRSRSRPEPSLTRKEEALSRSLS